MKKVFIISTILLLMICMHTHAQMEQYSYKRQITGTTEQWHKIVLPDDIFSKVSNDLSDIRIFGMLANGDTAEAPYILNVLSNKITGKKVGFNTLNASHNKKGYFFTFEVPTEEAVNQINLQFEQQNFDWLVKLEGSQNQQEWFTVLDRYRILSIQNESTDFQFTTLIFPSSKYRYFRVLVNSKKKPDLKRASMVAHHVKDGVLRDCALKNIRISENKAGKQTEIDVELQLPLPVSIIKINVNDTFDYYRPITVKYLSDSIKTEQGYKYDYRTLATGILHSLGKNELGMDSRTVQKLKLIILNQDNNPLTINDVEVKGYSHELVARFTKPGSYYLTYGNKKARLPNYDIKRFTAKIPEDLSTLKLGVEQSIGKAESQSAEPLFENKVYLWIIISVLILLLGWFSVGMIRRNTGGDL